MVMRLEFFFLWETAKLVQLLRLKREHMLISIGVHNEVKDYPKVKISLRMNRSEKKRSNLRDKSFFHYAFNQKWFRGGISMQSKEQQWKPSKGFNSKATLFKRLLHSRQKMSPLEFHFEFGHLFFPKIAQIGVQSWIADFMGL